MKRTIQYKHYPFERRTYAIAPPTLEKLEEAAVDFMVGLESEVVCGLGVAKVHPNDGYCKREGREVAGDHLNCKLKDVARFKIIYFKVSEDRIYFVIKNKSFVIKLKCIKNKEIPIVTDILSTKTHRLYNGEVTSKWNRPNSLGRPVRKMA